jgi:peptidoglycan hydrolase-like protein with peptidoglycan-binding domain
MHFEINDGQTIYDCIRALDAMRKFNGSLPQASAPAAPAPAPPVAPVANATVAIDIAALQTFARRVFPAYAHSVVVDGIYGPVTKNWVQEFQFRNKLTVDGVIGPQTLAALRRAGFKG